MPEIEINKLLVDFPYEPYEIQKDYMSKIIECLQKRTNGVLESPTGTGKTLSLLCSSLAWLCSQKATFQMRSIRGKEESDEFLLNLRSNLQLQAGSSTGWTENTLRPPKIVYASRTHSQLNQVMLELKKTAYRHVKVGVLGSRDQLCIHPKVSKESNVGSKVQMCKMLVATRGCPYYNNVENKVKEPLFQEDRLIDIEDLVKKGKQTQCCPYYATRTLQHESDILFTPYNYLLDPKIRKAQDIRLMNDVVILDEAHNVEKVCEESSSSQISSTTIALCINEITAVMRVFHNEIEQNFQPMELNLPKDFNAEELALLKTMFMMIEKEIDSIQLTSSGDKKAETFAGSHIFNILKKAEITPNSMNTLLETLNKVCQFLTTTNESQIHQQGAGLSKFMEFLEVVLLSLGLSRSTENTDFNYKLYIEADVPKTAKNSSSWATTHTVDSGGKILNFWCFNPGFSMKSLYELGVHSIILTSGTLSPLSATISEIGIPVDVQLSNPHIIKSNQICAVVVDKGPASTELKCVFQNRSNQKYISDLGQTCLNFYRIIPGGVLVFFPSYPLLKSCTESWQESGLWDRMAALKSIFVEPQNKDALKPLMEEYYKIIEENKGASLFAVCRGKVSEGLDFTDSRARAVIVIGLPYPPFYDPKVILKRAYMDNGKKQNRSKLDGNEWYQLEATRAVNQAIGRVIRHATDHGAVIFCDCRFSYTNNIKSLSAWLQQYIVPNASFGQAFKIVTTFFKNWKEFQCELPVKQEMNILQDNSQIKYRSIQPAQKLAPSTSSKTADLTKLYKTDVNYTKKVLPSPQNVKRKSLLDSLDEDLNDSEKVLPTESAPESTSSKNSETGDNSTKNVFNFQQSKKRKINVVPMNFDSKATEVKFDLKKFTLMLNKAFNQEQTKMFREALTNYSTSHDCEAFISTLSELFLSGNDTQLKSFFRDVPHFLINEEHKKIFWQKYYKLVQR